MFDILEEEKKRKKFYAEQVNPTPHSRLDEAINPRGVGSTVHTRYKPLPDLPYEEANLEDRLTDSLLDLGSGLVSLQEAGIGLADMATFGLAGKLTEATGYDTQGMKRWLSEHQSEERQHEQKQVSKKFEEEGFFSGVREMLSEPATIVGAGVQSVPSIAAIVAGGAGLAGAVPALSRLGAAAVAEGGLIAGSTAEGIRQETESGYIDPRDIAYSGAAGVLGGALSLVGGKVAQKLGVVDPDIMLRADLKNKDLIKNVVGGMISEGVFEELPQSAQEQVMQNLALEKPWDEGLEEAAGAGMLAGAAAGGAVNIFSMARNKVDKAVDDATTAVQEEELKTDFEEKQASEQLRLTYEEGIKSGTTSTSLLESAQAQDDIKHDEWQAKVERDAEAKRQNTQRMAEEVFERLNFADTVLSDLVADPFVVQAAAGLGADMDTFNRSSQVAFVKSKNFSEFKNSLVSDFGSKASKIAHKLYSMYKSSPLGDERGSMGGRYKFLDKGQTADVNKYTTDGRIPIKAKRFTIRGIEDIGFHVRKEGNNWIVSEESSGRKFADAKTQKGAIEKAIEVLDTHGVDKLRELTAASIAEEQGQTQKAPKTGFTLSADKLGKDQGKADVANAFIGFGSDTRKSSTGQYAEDAKRQGIPVNEEIDPTENTVAFVSVSSEGAGNTKAIEQAKRVLDSGGMVVMDAQGTGKGQSHSSWNKKGEGAVQEAISDIYGAPKKSKGGYSVWVGKKAKKPAGKNKPTSRKLQMTKKNIYKISIGQKTATTRTYPLKKGIHTLPDGTQVEVLNNTKLIDFSEMDGEVYAKAEGYDSVQDMYDNSGFKHIREFIDGKIKLHVAKLELIGEAKEPTAKVESPFKTIAVSDGAVLTPEEDLAGELGKIVPFQSEEEMDDLIVEDVEEGGDISVGVAEKQVVSSEEEEFDSLLNAFATDPTWDYSDDYDYLGELREKGDRLNILQKELGISDEERRNRLEALAKKHEDSLEESEEEQDEVYEDGDERIEGLLTADEASSVEHWSGAVLKKAWGEIQGYAGTINQKTFDEIKKLWNNTPKIKNEDGSFSARNVSNQIFLDRILLVGHKYNEALNGTEEIELDEATQAFKDGLNAASERIAIQIANRDGKSYMPVKSELTGEIYKLPTKSTEQENFATKIAWLNSTRIKEVNKVKKSKLSAKNKKQNIAVLNKTFDQKVAQIKTLMTAAVQIRKALVRTKAMRNPPVDIYVPIITSEALWENGAIINEVLAPIDEVEAQKQREKNYDAVQAMDLNTEDFQRLMKDVPEGLYDFNSFDDDTMAGEDDRPNRRYSTPQGADVEGVSDLTQDVEMIARAKEWGKYRVLYPLSKEFGRHEKDIEVYAKVLKKRIKSLYAQLNSNKQLSKVILTDRDKDVGILKSEADFIIHDIQSLALHYNIKTIEAFILGQEDIETIAALGGYPESLADLVAKHNNGTLEQIFFPYDDADVSEALETEDLEGAEPARGPLATTRKLSDVLAEIKRSETLTPIQKEGAVETLTADLRLSDALTHTSHRVLYENFLEAINDTSVGIEDYTAFYQTVYIEAAKGKRIEVFPLDPKVIAKIMAAKYGLGSKKFKKLSAAKQEKIVEKIISNTNVLSPFEYNIHRGVIAEDQPYENSKLLSQVRTDINTGRAAKGDTKISNEQLWDELSKMYTSAKHYQGFYTRIKRTYGEDALLSVSDLYDELRAYHDSLTLYSTLDKTPTETIHEIQAPEAVGTSELRFSKISLLNVATDELIAVEYMKNGTLTTVFVTKSKLKSFKDVATSVTPIGIKEYVQSWEHKSALIRLYDMVVEKGMLEEIALDYAEHSGPHKLRIKQLKKEKQYDEIRSIIESQVDDYIYMLDTAYVQLVSTRGESEDAKNVMMRESFRLRAALAQRQHTDMINSKNFFKDLAKKYKMNPVKMFEAYNSNGGDKSAVYRYILDKQAERVADAAYMGKVEDIQALLVEEDREVYRKHIKGEKISGEDAKRLSSVLQIIQLATDKSTGKASDTIATIKHRNGQVLAPSDYFQEIEPVDAFSAQFIHNLKGKSNDSLTKLGRMRDPVAQEFYEKVAKAFGADLIIISSQKHSSQYIPVAEDGRAKIVVNVNSATPVHRLYAHELIHHLFNKATKEEFKEFKNKIIASVGKDKFDDITAVIMVGDIRLTKEAAQEEALAEVFSTVFWKPAFYETLNKNKKGQSAARDTLVELFDKYSNLLDVYNAEGETASFEKMLFMSNDHMVKIAGLFADIVGATKASAALRHETTKYSTDDVVNELKDYANRNEAWFKKQWKNIFPEESEGLEDFKDNIEELFKKIPELLNMMRPSFMYQYWMTDQHARDVSFKYVHGVALELYKYRQRTIKDRATMFEKHSEQELMMLHDFFARNMRVFIVKKTDDEGNETTGYVNKKHKMNPFTKKGKFTKAFRKFALAYSEEAAIKAYEVYGDVSAVVRTNFITEEVLDMFEDFKAAADEIHKMLSKHYDLPYIENHYAQMLQWFTDVVETTDPTWILSDEASRLAPKRGFEEKRTQDVNSFQIAETRKVRSFDPAQIFYEYVRNASKLYLFNDFMEEAAMTRSRVKTDKNGEEVGGTLLGLIFPNEQVALSHGYYKLPDALTAIYKKFEEGETEAIKVGYKVAFTEEEETYHTAPTFPTEAAAQSYIDDQVEKGSNIEYFIEEATEEAKSSEVARMYFHKDIATLVGNLFEKDLIRSTKWGSKTMDIKNHYTSWEFAFSLFHGMTIMQEVFASSASATQQINQMTGSNKPVYKNPYTFLKGSLEGMLNFKTLVDKVYGEPSLASNPHVAKEIERFLGLKDRDVIHLVELYFQGGGIDKMDRMLRASAHYLGTPRYRKDKREVLISDEGLEYTKGSISLTEFFKSLDEVYEKLRRENPGKPIENFLDFARFSALEGSIAWLMEVAIPAIKMAAALQDMAIALEKNKHLIEQGILTEAEVVQRVIRFNEDKFGEKNWQNDFHNKTAQSVLMFMWRSYTWFTGSISAGVKGPSDIIRTGWFNHVRGKHGTPDQVYLTGEGLWVFNAVAGHLMVAAVMTTLMGLLFAWTDDDEAETPEETPLLTKLLFPRSDELDPNKRVSIPSYITEFYKIARHTGAIGDEAEYSKMISGRFNSLLSKSLQLYHNQNWRGVTIVDKDDNIAENAFDALWHMAPAPISLSTAMRSIRDKGFDISDVAMGLGGYVSAPAAALRSDATNKAYELRRKEYKGREISEDEFLKKQEVKRAAYAYSRGNFSKMAELVEEGTISSRQKDRALTKVQYIEGKKNPTYIDPLTNAVKGLTIYGAIEVWGHMTDKEKATQKGLIIRKYNNMLSRKDRSKNYKTEVLKKLEKEGIM